MKDSSPCFPSSFDPAIHLHSELDAYDAPHEDVSYSDDLEALHDTLKETTAEKNRQGIVIQHRAWKLPDVFRSEENYIIDSPLRAPRTFLPSLVNPTTSSSYPAPPSSPPISTMPMISSPVAYPPSSSPKLGSPKKRKWADVPRSPLKDVDSNYSTKAFGGFLQAESDDEDDFNAFLSKKRARTVLKDVVADNTPPASQGESVLDPETVAVEDLDAYFKTPSPVKQAQEPQDPVPTTDRRPLMATTAAGRSIYVGQKTAAPLMSYEQLIASRSTVVEGKAQRSYYGIDIHQLMDDAIQEDMEAAKARENERNAPKESVEQPQDIVPPGKNRKTLMWTEKYRARKFTDLVGDERTHRSVLRWLKSWDPIVFPGSSKSKAKAGQASSDDVEEQKHRRILMLTGPPGLGKTTLAHVCARQAGYEIQEINASDERSHNVVKGRIRDMVGTENVRGVNTKTADGKTRKAGKPVCVVVDEVDGVVGGSGGSGEGGFIKALIDLVNLDQKNSSMIGVQTNAPKKKRKGDKFRLLRPLILICNDVYHPSLRPLRQSSIAEIVHIRKPPLNMVISRMHSIFEKEGIPCDSDGVRRLCEATWGVSTKKEGGTGTGTGEGDIRGVMVVGEWIAGKLRSSLNSQPGITRLTRRWIEDNVLDGLSHGGGAARSLGRGGAKEVAERVFREGAGFPKSAVAVEQNKGYMDGTGVIGVAEASKRRAMERLREMIDTSGETDKIAMDCFTSYPNQPWQDDTFLSKPNAAYEWLSFHDTLSSAVHGSQEWELAPYLSQSVLAFHHLFASSGRAAQKNSDPSAEESPFTGPSAPYTANEVQRSNKASLVALQSSLTLPLTRMFRSPEDLATDLLPYVLRMLSPDIKPVIVNTGSTADKNRNVATASVRKASEKVLVKRAVDAMAATGVRFERSRVEFDDAGARGNYGGWVFRMEPPLDVLGQFETMGGKRDEKVRFAVRQVLEMEWKRESMRLEGEARRKRGGGDEFEEVFEKVGKETPAEEAKRKEKMKEKLVKRDFFGRAIVAKPVPANGIVEAVKRTREEKAADEKEGRVWISFHEGFSNAVRKPITIEELMRGL
ncbi:uncharacterized protein BDZ99DRAFT_404930 [Mytilinidion resinicola]|uniref:AAA+ ATPase domain-containing protein n=1 Tax=Mytilinidion resinicola TaxID=574789 RepID=A0A6A6ZAU7_9PEZI|nr:uncharacterized protein BDZ99DRAFT_404930 [Mytilinidion resinicola]KAF2817337.1 hypothetical protein BDZ99DRAFT_404930 [Mytilinidion resinicola]